MVENTQTSRMMHCIRTYKRGCMHVSTYMTKIHIYWHVYGKNKLKYTYLCVNETNTCIYAYKCLNTHIQGTLRIYCHTYAYICSYARRWKTLRIHVLEITPTRIYALIRTYKHRCMHISAI